MLSFFDNRRFTYGMTFLRGYFSHFDPNFLFLDKSIGKYHAPDMGLLYLFELPLILLGFYIMIARWGIGSAIIFWWILVAPVAAAFTLQLPHPVRTIVFLPTFSIMAAIGLVALVDSIRRRWKSNMAVRWLLFGVGICVIVASVMYYLLRSE